MKLSPRTSALLLLTLCTGSLASQNPVVLPAPKLATAAPSAGPESQLTLDVVVTDHAGKPVSGLDQHDLNVLEDKQPTPATSFRAVTGSSATAADPVQLILVIDEVNTNFERVAYVRDNVRKFLQLNEGRLAHPTTIMFFTDSGTDIVENQNNGMALADAVAKHDSQLRTIRRSQGFYGADDRLDLSLHTLSSIAAREATEPGRKLMVWISPGWPYLSGPNIILTRKQQESLFNSIVQTNTLLRRARITLSSVDPIGAGANVIRTSFYEQFLKGVTKPNDVALADLSLQVLAAQSGGRVLAGNNDTAGQIAVAASDAEAFYVLTIPMRGVDTPGQYHSLQVKTEASGLTARTRTGYYAQPPAPGPDRP